MFGFQSKANNFGPQTFYMITQPSQSVDRLNVATQTVCLSPRFGRVLRLCLVLACMGFFAGCDLDMPGQSTRKNSKYVLPVSVSKQPPFTYRGELLNLFGGDSFETIEDKHLHFVIVEGISTPGWNQPFREDAENYTRQLGADRPFEIEVLFRDEITREIAHVYVIDEHQNKINLGLSLLELSLIHI